MQLGLASTNCCRSTSDNRAFSDNELITVSNFARKFLPHRLQDTAIMYAVKTPYNKNLCGRDGRTICGPQCVPKSTSVMLAVDEKTLPMATITGRTDRRTDRQTDRQSATQYAAPPREEGRIIITEFSPMSSSSMSSTHVAVDVARGLSLSVVALSC